MDGASKFGQSVKPKTRLVRSSPDIGKDLKTVFPFSNQYMQVLIEGDGLAVNGCRPVFGGWWHGV